MTFLTNLFTRNSAKKTVTDELTINKVLHAWLNDDINQNGFNVNPFELIHSTVLTEHAKGLMMDFNMFNEIKTTFSQNVTFFTISYRDDQTDQIKTTVIMMTAIDKNCAHLTKILDVEIKNDHYSLLSQIEIQPISGLTGFEKSVIIKTLKANIKTCGLANDGIPALHAFQIA